ncbi:MAG TPA: CDP-alcohol phosphatidyltransferase family protein [Actinomycetota bacterium]|jgi:cardiolipin synthase|nr:CDP-alcohol phosphatidyltransferase family protein [Actinomycetota bacterium]
MDTSEGTPAAGSGRRVLTVPNAISALRIALIPVFVALILDEHTTTAGLIMFGCVIATDWVDGTIARRTGQVSELGKVLDPVADRLAIAAGIIALAIRGVFPVWAAVAIIARDVAILGVGVYLLSRRHIRLEVRWIGKVATFSLMVAVPAIAWGALDLPLAAAATAVGWVCFAVGIVEYYIAAGVYAQDARRALASP